MRFNEHPHEGCQNKIMEKNSDNVTTNGTNTSTLDTNYEHEKDTK